MNARLCHFTKIGADFASVHNRHTASVLLLEISLDHGNQLICGLNL